MHWTALHWTAVERRARFCSAVLCRLQRATCGPLDCAPQCVARARGGGAQPAGTARSIPIIMCSHAAATAEPKRHTAAGP